eukprot:9493952-Pyramimonas_sp.AAC.1
MKASGDSIVTWLLDAGLAYVETLAVKHIGVHPKNRHGLGLDIQTVQSVLKDITTHGWSDIEVAGARAFEKSENPDIRKVQCEFQDFLYNTSDGYLAAMAHEDLRILTVASSHTVAGARCVKAAAKSDNEELTTNGRLVVDKIMAKSPAYKRPLEHGVQFTTIRWQVEERIPELPDFLARASNTSKDAAKPQPKIETL